MFCREQVVQLHRETGTIHGRGAELVIVGNGNRQFARAFRDELGLETPLYVDTDKVAYRALRMKRGLTRVLRPAVVANGLRAMLSGSRQRRIQGDPLQLGGVLVVLPGGRVAYRYLSNEAGDHPPLSEVLAALPDPGA